MRPIPSQNRRSGFTLIELIVVMTIIVVIASLTLGVVSKGFGWVKQKNTEQTMTKALERIVQRRMTQIYAEASDWETNAALYRQAHGDARRAEALKVLYLYKWSFPHTYSEAFHNLQESLVLYDAVNGHPLARAIYTRLKSKTHPQMTDLQFTACPSPAEMPSILPRQSSSCLMAAFQCIFGSSIDEFTSNETLTLTPYGTPGAGAVDVPAQAVVLPDGTNLAQGYPSQNTMLTDAWGTPFFFLRHGNMWDNQGVPRAAINRAPFWMGLRTPAVPPITAVLGNYYDVLVNNPTLNNGRAYLTFRGRWNTDPFDPEGTFRNSEAWRAQFPSGPVTWLTGVHLSPPSPGAPGSWQHQDYFRSNFGYRPQPSNLNGAGSPPNRWAQEYAPFVMISAGGDKLFTTWDDNLDTYRLLINVSGQQ